MSRRCVWREYCWQDYKRVHLRHLQEERDELFGNSTKKDWSKTANLSQQCDGVLCIPHVINWQHLSRFKLNLAGTNSTLQAKVQFLYTSALEFSELLDGVVAIPPAYVVQDYLQLAHEGLSYASMRRTAVCI